jgi:hypothetical protein
MYHTCKEIRNDDIYFLYSRCEKIKIQGTQCSQGVNKIDIQQNNSGLIKKLIKVLYTLLRFLLLKFKI